MVPVQMYRNGFVIVINKLTRSLQRWIKKDTLAMPMQRTDEATVVENRVHLAVSDFHSFTRISIIDVFMKGKDA